MVGSLFGTPAEAQDAALAPAAATGEAQLHEQIPLYEQDPFDRITLNKVNNDAVLEIKPLSKEMLPERRVPDPLPKTGVLTVQLRDRATKYEVQWFAIAEMKLFEQLVLEEAAALVATAGASIDEANALKQAGEAPQSAAKRQQADARLDRAYDYFAFLEERHAELPGLPPAMEEYLRQESRAAWFKDDFDTALAMIRELHQRGSEWANLDAAMGQPTDKLIDHYVSKKGDYRNARQLLRNLAEWFPEQPFVAKWEVELRRRAAALLEQAEAAVDGGEPTQMAEAARLCRRIAEIWPELPGARQLAATLHERHPRVTVGVSIPAVALRPAALADAAARRSGRLVYRTLTELTAVGSEGGEYSCPLGSIDVESPDRITLQIHANVGFASTEATLTGYDVSRQLLALATPGAAAYRVDWADLLAGVSVEKTYTVAADLRRRHVRPDALLTAVVAPYTSSGGVQLPPPSNGPFVRPVPTEEGSVFAVNPHYFAVARRKPKEIIERHFAKGARAIRALRRGEVDVIDRVNPWDLRVRDAAIVLRGAVPGEQIAVGAYALPRIHCLIPNVRRKPTSSRTFRRALVYGIERQAILDQLTAAEKTEGGAAAGTTPAGGAVLSGPFPVGRSSIDPIGYACDPKIRERRRAYEPYLAMGLAEIGLREVGMAGTVKPAAAAEETPASDEAAAAANGETTTTADVPVEPTMRPLVLAYPNHEIAHVACTSIRQQLGLIGVPVELRPLDGPLPRTVPQDVDLLYAELAMWEPAVDARRLLGEDGMTGGCSPYMSQALRQLDAARDWDEVKQHLHDIHRIAHDDVAIVPLWQLTDHFAFRTNLRGIAAAPISLYQHVERWELDFRYATDTP